MGADNTVLMEEKRITTVSALFVLVGVAIVAFGIWYSMQLTSEQETHAEYVRFAEEQVVRVDSALSAADADALEGSLFFSAVPVGAGRLFPYAFNLATQTLTRGDRTGEQVTKFHTLSPDGERIAFVGTTRERFDQLGGNEDLAMQVYVQPYDELPPVIESAADAQSDELLRSKRALSLDNEGRVLYTAYPAHNGSVHSPAASVNNWSIYLSEPNRAHTRIVSGMYPHWISETEFLFLREDGVHVYDFETGTHTLVLMGPGPGGAALTPAVKLSVSDDAQFASVVDPLGEAVHVFAVAPSGDNTQMLTYLRTIPVVAAWAVFSPDNQALAVQEASAGGSAIVRFYSVETGVRYEYVITLPDFIQEHIFITDWR